MKKIFKRVATNLGLVQLALLTAAAARAQDTARALKTVVVTATRSPKKMSDIGRVVTVVTAEQINRSQGKTLPELLNSIPGVTFSGAENAPGIATSVYLRGASSGNTLILVDGFPVNNASAIDNSYDLNAFPIEQIDHIEILKGSGSTLYGSDAVAGVINIITKHAKGKGLKATAQFVGGSYNTFNESVALNGNVDNTGVALNLSNSDSKGFPAAIDTLGKGKFTNDGLHQQAASLNLTQKITDNFLLTGNLQTIYNKGNLPYDGYVDDQNFTYHNTFLFGGIGAKLLLKKGTLTLNASRNVVWYNFNNLPPDNDSVHSVTRNIGRITDVEAIFNYSINKFLDITSGADYKYNNTSQYSLFEEAFYHPNPDYTQISPDTAHNSMASAYTSLFFKYGIFHMELGGRFNHHSKYGNNLTYTVNPSLFIADQLKLFGTIATAFKAPSIYQLSSQYGNADLKPETTTSYETGFDWEIIPDMLDFNTAFFKRDTKDAIYFYTEPIAPYRSFYKNGDSEHDKGFESELTFKAGSVNGLAYATYVTGSQIDASGTTINGLIRRPKNTYGVNFNYQVMTNLVFGLNYKYTGSTNDNLFNYTTFTSSVVTLKQYNVFDAHLQWQACKKLMLFGDLKNIFDEKYSDWAGYAARGRNFMLGLKYQIN
ncbi:MAG: TonB-dependent receptor [Bacteroidetes bacterium]|nr:TonB-dependent receptor [Bacteroidota bacterium]